MKSIDKLSSAVMITVLLVAVVSAACQYTCDFCGSYLLDNNPSQWIVFQRDGKFQWVNALAQASGNWYADGGKITATINWGTFTGRIEGRRFTDSGGSIWTKTTEANSCILCCNVPRPGVNITSTPAPTQTLTPITYFNLGDWATPSPSWIVVSTAERMVQYRENATVEAPPDTFFIIVNVTVFNMGNSTISAQANLFNLSDKSSSIYGPVQLSVLVPNQFPWYGQALAPGNTMSGRILFVVSNQSSEMSVVTFVNGQYLAWVLPW